MMEFLGWVVFVSGLLNILAGTVLWPLMRRLNAWSFSWINRLSERQQFPFADRYKKLGDWWLARESLQQVIGIAMGLVLLVVWWFVWGPGAE
jgi:hypothetical protein